MALFKVENLSFTYRGETKKALDCVSFEIGQGETSALIGKSGSGKTTLLRMLKPSVRPKGDMFGDIIYYGGNGECETGFLFQNPADQSVCDNVFDELCFGLQNMGLPRDSIRLRVAEICAFFGLEEFLHRSVSELSGGEVQLVNLAAAAALSPSAILLDEPFAQLDPISCDRLKNALLKLKNELGTALIISSHSIENILTFTDRVIVLENGKVVKNGSTDCVISELKAKHDPLYKTAGELCSIPGGSVIKTVSQAREFLKTNKPGFCKFKKGVASGETLISANNIYMRFGKNLPDVLRGVNFEVKRKTVHGLCGANGSGKTTLMSVLCGVRKPYSGKVKSSVGAVYIPQDARLAFVKDTVYEDIKYMCEMSGIDQSVIEQTVSGQEIFYDIKSFFDRHPYDLSGGEVQKAALFKAVVCGKKVILMDEPAKGFDPETKQEFVKLVAALKKDHGIVISSHDMELLASVSDNISMMFDGGIVSGGEVSDFMLKNRFYTTSLARASRGICDGLIAASQFKCEEAVL